jgi:triacylglycerol esterase/lipase EstA (alpha/beta hydrolase family)
MSETVRLDVVTNDVPVVIISGLGAPRIAAVAYGQVLERRGFRTYAAPQRLLGYGDVRVAAGLVAEEVARVLRETGSSKVHLVGMSLGGLIGLYYVKCLGGAQHVDRFVSVGGPLNGSSLARVLEDLGLEATHALTQTTPDNDLMREIRAAAPPSGVRMISVGTRGDVMTPRASWDAEGFEPVESPYGVFPVGHWMLFLDPRNHQVVADCLQKP